MAGVTKDQWPIYMKEAYRILKPDNGWIQCSECSLLECDDGSMPDDLGLWKVIYVQFSLTADSRGNKEEIFSPLSKRGSP